MNDDNDFYFERFKGGAIKGMHAGRPLNGEKGIIIWTIEDAVKKLSLSENRGLSNAIWAEDMNITTEHQNIVNERVAAYKSNPEILLDWDVASKNLKA